MKTIRCLTAAEEERGGDLLAEITNEKKRTRERERERERRHLTCRPLSESWVPLEGQVGPLTGRQQRRLVENVRLSERPTATGP